MSFWQISLSIFIVLNALGTVPVFLGLLSKYDPRRQRRIILRELLIALGVLLLFNFFGNAILKVLGISNSIIGIAGGVVLFLISLSMIFPKTNGHKPPSQEPMIVPLAIPLVAGPGAITSVMVYAEQVHDPMLMMGAILVAWFPSALILFSASNIKHLLGDKGLLACERLGGMLLCLISVKMFFCGLLEICQ